MLRCLGLMASPPAISIDNKDFRSFLNATKEHDFDLMLETKDKEQEALEALKIASGDARLVTAPWPLLSASLPRQHAWYTSLPAGEY